MKTVLIAVLFLFLPCLTLAAPADSLSTERPHSLRAGVWALQFDVNGQLLSVESFAGGLSLKRQFAPTWALRFGIGFSGRGSSSELSDDPAFEGTNDFYGVSLETVYQRYLNPGSVVNAYWGLGPSLDFSHQTTESSRDSSSTERTSTQWGAGLIVSLGAEWFFAKQFSLHGEFTAVGSYFKREDETIFARIGQPDVYRKSEEDGWSYGTTNNVRLGLSVYF